VDEIDRAYKQRDEPKDRCGNRLFSEIECELKKLPTPILTEADARAGVGVYETGNERYKDFTVPIDTALRSVVREVDIVLLNYRNNPAIHPSRMGGILGWFRSIVNINKPWDIKLENRWNETIARDTFPGRDAPIVYNGMIVTPESLGNYTYGYIGAALGIPLNVLYGGSWYADGFSTPSNEESWLNEMQDWANIEKGFNAYRR
jgi:hypothetical protein